MNEPGKNLYYAVVPQVAHVAVHGRGAPSDTEWIAYLEDAASVVHDIKGLFVHCAHGSPNARQREIATNHWERVGMAPKICILTPSRIVRGTVTALGWFLGPRIRAFDAVDFEGGAGHLGLDRGELARVKAKLLKLSTEAGVELAGFGLGLDAKTGAR